MSLFKVDIITPHESYTEKEVSFADFPAVSGRVTVLAHHQDMVCALKNGETVFHSDKGREKWSTGKGFLRVNRNRVILLTHFAEPGDKQKESLSG